MTDHREKLLSFDEFNFVRNHLSEDHKRLCSSILPVTARDYAFVSRSAYIL